MLDTNLVIRVTRRRQPRLGIGLGCLLAIASASAEVAKAQIVQAAGESSSPTLETIQPGNLQPGISTPQTPTQLVSGDSGRFSSRKVLVQLEQKGDASPSDQTKEQEDKGEAKADANKDTEGSVDSKSDDDKVKGNKEAANNANTGKGITPVQSGGLRLSVDRVNISTVTIGTGQLPEDTAAKRSVASSPLLDGQSRGIVAQQVNWRPAAICHLPLYFEDAMLERHGHVRWGCAQPIVSGTKFLATIPLLPYISTLQPPCQPRYTLGHFRPGNCAPALKDHLPWDRRAATVEVVSLGAFFWAAPL